MDDEEITRIADRILVMPELADLPPERRAEIAFDLAKYVGLEDGLTVAGADDVARVVRRTVVWRDFMNRDKKGPT